MREDPTDIASQRRSALEGAAARRAARQQELKHLRQVLASAEGRAFVRALLDRTGVFRSSYAAGDALAMAFHEGARNVGLQIVADLNEADPHAFAHLLMENTDGKQQHS